MASPRAPTHDLEPVEDDGSVMDITDPSFNSEDPTTWGFTPPERKVDGLAVRGGRLYYAVAAGPQIWSVGIKADGSFGDATLGARRHRPRSRPTKSPASSSIRKAG